MAMNKLRNSLIHNNLIGGGKFLIFNYLRHNFLQGQSCAKVRVAALAAFLMAGIGAHAAEPQDTAKVYVCTGSASYAYHTNHNCEGLQQCNATIRETTAKEARKQGRKYCGYCRKTTIRIRPEKEADVTKIL